MMVAMAAAVAVVEESTRTAGCPNSACGHCVIYSCDNIHSWISLGGDLAFSHQDGIYSFKFPERFLEISSRDLTLLSILII